MKFTIKLNLKSIIRAEQLLGKPFCEFDYTDQKEFFSLLYCCVLMNNDVSFTYEEFLSMIENDKLLREMADKFNRVCRIEGQFEEKRENTGEEKEGGRENGTHVFIKDIVAMLAIDSGIDTGYLLEEAALGDLYLYLKAYDNRKKEGMEAQRLWTFLTCAPHIDVKKIKSAREFYTFPWEREEMRHEEEARIKTQEAEFYKFLQEGKNYLKPKNE